MTWPPRVSSTIVLLVAIGSVAIQLAVFPVTSTAITAQAVIETAFLLLVVVGAFAVPSAGEVTDLSADEARAVSSPLVAGLALVAIRATTDLLDEFLAHPTHLHSLLEDGSMIGGVGLVLLGISRLASIRERRAGLLRDQRDRLDRQNDRLEAFAGVVSHDLRNPLEVAAGRLDLAIDSGDRTHLDAARAALDRMDVIIEDVLALARLGPEAVEPTTVSLRGVAERAWDTVETSAAVLEVEVDDDATVTADEAYLRRLFENLFRNAVDHAGPDVLVRVGAHRSGFFVEDTGPGIPPEERALVFEGSYSTAEEGTGIGLSIVEEIARAHGWSIRATESREGGARFEIRVHPPDRPEGRTIRQRASRVERRTRRSEGSPTGTIGRDA